MPTKAFWKNVEERAKPLLKQQSQLFDKVLLPAISAATIPLLKHEDISRLPMLIGTGVLVKKGDKLFLFTAAHVLQEFNNTAIVTHNCEKFIGITGESCRTTLPKSKTHYDDHFDAAVLYLDHPLPEGFIEKAVHFDDVSGPKKLAGNDSYLIHGYPHKQTKGLGKVFHVPPLTLINADMGNAAYQRLGYSTETHILIHSPKRWYSQMGVQKAKSLHGMSGCGIWEINFAKGKLPIARLAAIVTDNIKAKSSLVGIRVELHQNLVSRGWL